MMKMRTPKWSLWFREELFLFQRSSCVNNRCISGQTLVYTFQNSVDNNFLPFRQVFQDFDEAQETIVLKQKPTKENGGLVKEEQHQEPLSLIRKRLYFEIVRKLILIT